MAGALSHIPTWLKSFVVFTIRNLDKIGLMPKMITTQVPFTPAFFITDVGSLESIPFIIIFMNSEQRHVLSPWAKSSLFPLCAPTALSRSTQGHKLPFCA